MEPERKGLAISNMEGERIIDGRFRTLAARIPTIIEEIVGDRPIEPKDRSAIMARVERELDKIFPAQRGEESLITGDIQQATNRARDRGVKTAMAPVIDAVKTDPELWGLIRERSASQR